MTNSGEHSFKAKYFSHFTWCEVCDEFLWGVFNTQGLECEQCKLVCHERCAGESSTCSGTAARIRDELQRKQKSTQFDKACKDMRSSLGDSIPQGEELIAWFSSAWYKGHGVPRSGKIYVTKHYVAFCSPKKLIMVEEIIMVEKKNSREVVVGTPEKEFLFMLLKGRDQFVDLLNYLCLTVDNDRIGEAVATDDISQLRRVLSKAKSRKRLAGSNVNLEQHVKQECMNLINAVELGRLEMIPLLLNEESIDINATTDKGYTALHCALAGRHELAGTRMHVDEETILLLLESEDIRLDITNKDGNTAFHYFCFSYPFPDCHKIAKMMIEKGADVNAQNAQGETPLHRAIQNSYIRLLMVQLLLEQKVNLNVQNKLGNTPLHYAVGLGREDLVLLLLSAGADPLITGRNGDSIVKIAERGNRQLVPILFSVVHICEATKEEGLDPRIRLALVRDELAEPGVLNRVDEAMCDRMGVNNPAHRAKLLRLARTHAMPSSPAARALQMQEELKSMPYMPPGELMFIDAEKIEFTEKIGTGASGKVWKALFSNMTVAVKVLKNPEGSDITEFKREVQIMASINTPHTVQFYGCVLEPKVCLVMELCARKSLYHVLNGERDFGWDKFFSFAEQCVKGVHSLHTHDPPILHRDLKSLNLLVTQDWRVKICDYGLARFNTHTNQNTLQRTRGTVAYMCPEIFEGKIFTVKSDVFSVGIILWEMVSRIVRGSYERPYSDMDFDYQIISQVAKLGLRPQFPAGTPASLIELISRCWAHDVDPRPTCEQLLKELSRVHEEYVNNSEEWRALANPNIVVFNDDFM